MRTRENRRLRTWPAWLFAFAVLAAGIAVVAAARPENAAAGDGVFVVVKHTLTLSDDGSVALDREESTVSAQYVVNAHRWAASSMPISVRFNPAGQPADYGMAAIIQNATNTWNAVTPSTFSYGWDGTSSGGVGSCGDAIDTDGQNTIKFEPLTGVTLGRTCTVWSVSQGPNAKLVEFDMELDSDADTWSTANPPPAGKYDLASTVLHELGHAAGLGHSNDAAAVMFPTLKNGTSKRALTADDIAGMQSAYPGGAPATPTTGPLPPTTPRARAVALAADSAPGQSPPTPRPATPTAVATATKSPTQAPTAIPSSGVQAYGATWYVSEYTGTVYVEGLVQNGTSGPVGFAKVTANFYGPGGQLLATDFSYSEIETIPAGGTSPFTILLIDPPGGITSVNVLVTDYDTTPFDPPVSGLSIAVSNVYRNIIGTVHIVGTVTNTSGLTYTYVKPIGAFVDGSGTVIRADFTFTEPSTLGPGASGTFDMLFIGAPDGMESANLLTWVDADQ